jgi:hypothetical protein
MWIYSIHFGRLFTRRLSIATGHAWWRCATQIVSNVSVEETARTSLEAQLTVNSWHKSCQGTLLFVHGMSQVNSAGCARGNGATTRIRPGRHCCSKPSLDLEWLKVVVESPTDVRRSRDTKAILFSSSMEDQKFREQFAQAASVERQEIVQEGIDAARSGQDLDRAKVG